VQISKRLLVVRRIFPSPKAYPMKNVLIVTAVLASLLNFPIRSKGQQNTSTDKQQTASDQGIPPSTPVRNDRPQEKTQTTSQEVPDWNSVAQWALVFVGFATAAVVGWQACETRKAAEASADQVAVARRALTLQFRPRVIIRVIRINETNDQISLAVTVVNNGGSDAQILQGTANLEWIFAHSAKTHVATAHFEPAVLMPGKQQELAISLADDWINYRFSEDPSFSSQMRLRCEGTIVYTDLNGIDRHTGFSRLRNASTKKWDVDTDPEYEYQD